MTEQVVSTKQVVEAMRARGYNKITISLVDKDGDWYASFIHDTVVGLGGRGVHKDMDQALEIAAFNAIPSEGPVE